MELHAEIYGGFISKPVLGVLIEKMVTHPFYLLRICSDLTRTCSEHQNSDSTPNRSGGQPKVSGSVPRTVLLILVEKIVANPLYLLRIFSDLTRICSDRKGLGQIGADSEQIEGVCDYFSQTNTQSTVWRTYPRLLAGHQNVGCTESEF